MRKAHSVLFVCLPCRLLSIKYLETRSRPALDFTCFPHLSSKAVCAHAADWDASLRARHVARLSVLSVQRLSQLIDPLFWGSLHCCAEATYFHVVVSAEEKLVHEDFMSS